VTTPCVDPTCDRASEYVIAYGLSGTRIEHCFDHLPSHMRKAITDSQGMWDMIVKDLESMP